MAWTEVTDLSSSKQSIVVALSLPEEDETQIRDKVFDQLHVPLEELKKENGLSIGIAPITQYRHVCNKNSNTQWS